MAMQLTAIIMLSCCLQVNAVAFGQQVTIQKKNMTLREVFKDIRKQSGYNFLYSNKTIAGSGRVSLDVTDADVPDILDQAFAGKALTYTIENKVIIVKRKPVLPELISETPLRKEISGVVKDSATGESLVGVTIKVKGGTTGTTTDINGRFSLEVSEDAVLEVSYVGYSSKSIPVDGQNNLNILLASSATGLNQLVVVGYGTQKKKNLTGSVSTLNSNELHNIPVTQTSQLLNGRISGINIKRNSSQPGKDEGNIVIHGLGTFSGAGNNPLVIVDGIPSTIEEVNPADIKSISVLKDAASASIYGSRAANGVILIQTKEGVKGKTKINYEGYIGISGPREIPDFVDSWVYAEMRNEALSNEGKSPAYSKQEIENFKSGKDPKFPNKRHYDDLVHSGSGIQTNHYLSVEGGSNNDKFRASFRYFNQEGIVKRTGKKLYSLRLNYKRELGKKVRLGLKIYGNNTEVNEPTSAGNMTPEGANSLIEYAVKIPNTIPGELPDGSYGNFTGFTVEGWMNSDSYVKNLISNVHGQGRIDWNIINNLKLSGIASYNYGIINYNKFRSVLVVDTNLTEGPNNLTQRKTINKSLNFQVLLNYDLSFNENAFHLLLGYSQEGFEDRWTQGYRDNFPNNLLHQLNAGSQSNMKSSGSGYGWGLQSVFGRLTYNYRGKYLLEANGRYDGSSRFSKGRRFGFFPSISAGWRLSEEDFFKNKIHWISNLKIRGSWGDLGNQNIGNYPYQQTLSLGIDYPLGNSESLRPGAASINLANKSIHWEKTRVVDIGIDIGIFKDKLDFSVDYFNKYTSDILYNISVSSILGMNPPVQNAGAVSNKGIDLNIHTQNTIGSFSYRISANFSYTKNTVKKIATLEKDINKGLFVGHSLRSIYGYVSEGLFIDKSDIQKSPTQPYAASPGDIKFKDISGPNGVPDGKVTPNYDRKIIGNRFPKYNFGGSISIGYNNFNLFVQLSGVGGLDNFLSGYQSAAFYLGSNPQKWMVDNRWTKSNHDPNAKYPKLSIINANSPQFYTSTYFMRNASYLNISEVQLGYNFPKSIVKRLNIDNLRLYITGQNLYSFNSFYPGWDPQLVPNYFPPIRTFSFGIDLTF